MFKNDVAKYRKVLSSSTYHEGTKTVFKIAGAIGFQAGKLIDQGIKNLEKDIKNGGYETAHLLGRAVGVIAYNIAEGYLTAGLNSAWKALQLPKLADVFRAFGKVDDVLKPFTKMADEVAQGVKTVDEAGNELLEQAGKTKPSSSPLLKVFQDSCFAAGTPIITPSGSELIENLRVGDLILSRDENDVNAPVVPRAIEKVFTRTAPILRVVVAGRVIETTAEHPFYVRYRGWLNAHELREGDELNSHTGTWVRVHEVSDSGRVATVYNFRITEHHTYFVGCEAWGFSVWAHNTEYELLLTKDGKFQLRKKGTTDQFVKIDSEVPNPNGPPRDFTQAELDEWIKNNPDAVVDVNVTVASKTVLGKAAPLEVTSGVKPLNPDLAAKLNRITEAYPPNSGRCDLVATKIEAELKVAGHEVEIVGLRQQPPITKQFQPGAAEEFAEGWHVVVHDKTTGRYIDSLTGGKGVPAADYQTWWQSNIGGKWKTMDYKSLMKELGYD